MVLSNEDLMVRVKEGAKVAPEDLPWEVSEMPEEKFLGHDCLPKARVWWDNALSDWDPSAWGLKADNNGSLPIEDVCFVLEPELLVKGWPGSWSDFAKILVDKVTLSIL